jgi:purine nucleoside permease
MRVLGILAIVALSWLGQPALAHAAADFAASANQAAADAAASMDWMLFNLRLKLVLVFFLTAAIAGLAHLASRSQTNRHSELAPVRVR